MPRRLFLAQALPAAALAALLAVLGTLQYRWLSQVAEAERERLRRDAQRRAEALAQDFDREVTRAYVMLQVPPEAGTTRAAAEFSRRWERWQSRTPHPGMVTAVYLLEPKAGARPALSRFDPAQGRFAPVGWPPALDALRRQVETRAREPPPMPVLPEVPALVSPVPDVLALEREPGPGVTGGEERLKRVVFQRRTGPWQSWGCTVVLLDREYLLRRLLPELSARHLAGNTGPDYELTVLRGAPGEVLWSNGGPRLHGDAEAPALQVRFDDLERSLLDSLVDAPGAAARPGPDHFRVRLATGVVASLGPSGEAARTGGWRFVLAHRAGSVDVLASRLRRRNLALSFGVLGVLAASMVLVVVSSQRARSLAARQMEFVAGVSHELRTPVAVIRSAAENVADGVVTDAAQVRRYGTVIRDQADRLTGMLEQVLSLAGAEGRRADTQAIAPGDVVRSALEEEGPELRSAGVPVELDIAQDLPPVAGDPDALRRAVGNLVANARRHAGGSPLRVRARRAADGGVDIDVEDQGPGIDPADLPHVFEPFYRGRRAVAEQVPGTGLGLAVVRGVTEAHGGRVSVRSRPAEGATFTLHLPAHAAR